MVSGQEDQIAGEQYTLACTVNGGAMGVTTSAYRWLRNNTLQTEETSDTVSFTPLSQNDDNGSYTCEAIRSGRTYQSSSFNISVRSKFLPIT